VGHVNSFDEARLRALFGKLKVARLEHVGSVAARMNAIAALLMDLPAIPHAAAARCATCSGPVGSAARA
jgi:hypothetical protein